MNISVQGSVACAIASATLLVAVAGDARAVDAAAAQGLARQSACFTCHSVDKKKVAIPWKDVAAKYKGKPDAEATLIKHITTGPKVKTEDGTEMDHPIVKSKNQDDIKNLADWILSL